MPGVLFILRWPDGAIMSRQLQRSQWVEQVDPGMIIGAVAFVQTMIDGSGRGRLTVHL
jgi:hypothetical protein